MRTGAGAGELDLQAELQLDQPLSLLGARAIVDCPNGEGVEAPTRSTC